MKPDHKYRPDPKTARCLDCIRGGPERDALGPHRCSWCGHTRGEHTGKVDPDVKLHLSRPNPHAGHGTAPDRLSTVRWSTSACGMFHCACSTYEK